MEANFYQVDEDGIIKSLAPLLLKILEEKKRVIIFCDNQVQINEMDNSLWSYGRNKFIPHVTIFDRNFTFDRQPILISNEERNLNKADYLIFLSEVSKEFSTQFSRVFYFFESHNYNSAKILMDKFRHLSAKFNSYKKEKGKWTKES